MRSGRLVLAICLLGASACASSADDQGAPGALVRTTMDSTVGVVLDEIPEAMRDRVAAAIMERPEDFWQERAGAQLRLTAYRLNFRGAFYDEVKGQLPLPPEPLWNIDLAGAPTRRTVQGHDVVAVDYAFSSTLLTGESSPGESEPELERVGGSWEEPFDLPIDPELLLQRTGFACMDEEDYPFGSVDSEEVDKFYDQEAEAEATVSNVGQSHNTRPVDESCLEALERHVGRVEADVRFERIRWDGGTADESRYGTVTGDAADLAVYEPGFTPSRITYRYIPADSCEVVEDSVGGTGWRRLLQFATSDENVGNEPLVLGEVAYALEEEPPPFDEHNLFEFSACHQHYHFSYYGDSQWTSAGRSANSKKAFCLQSTGRPANREASPLAQPFGGCDFQGVAAGWLDEYQAGLPSQWLDITDSPEGTGTRSFHSNPQGFLCEGRFVDRAGEAVGPAEEAEWVPTDRTATNGEPVEIQRCELAPGYADNNVESVREVIPPPGQGLITTPCDRGQIGPLRNCGFGPDPTVATCAAGEETTATFGLPPGAPPQVVRLAEYSTVLRSPIPARYEDSWVPLSPGVSDEPYLLANEVATPRRPLSLTFTCPGPRTAGEAEPGGRYSIYTAPVFPDDDAVAVDVQGRA